ncbi:SgcJ/EcaC family oxidoreductase [Nocardia arthritidis]|uniref:SgcJ/EcaC family oxidoreductase n=1 Tax=Nocardia arthritidis TaxID=228602 RepID=A0A6G9YGK3_9NOCA|nr:SgcJ/EcaC family oxidoreductase [Nocardia arthritidis]QIS12270.1 SgcJ/EcaC family oxidoreductase [Nocardia arthritidis]
MSVDDILALMRQSWERGDASSYAALFTEDATFVDVLGRVQRGRAVIAREHQKLFDTIYRDSRWAGRVERVADLGDGVVVVNSVSELSVPRGPRAGITAAVQTMVVVDGSIAWFHNTVRTGLADFADHDADLAALSPLGWASGAESA